MKKIYVILPLLLSACAKHTPVVQIDEPFKPYVTAFQARAAMVGYNVKISDLIVTTVDSFSDPNVVGMCLGMNQNDQTPTISVSKFYWPKLEVSFREEMLFHELGHCVLNRNHRPDQSNNLSLSVMNPYIFGSRVYEANYGQYMHELFFQSDLPSALPLLFFNDDPTYVSTVSGYFSSYTSGADLANNKVMITDLSAPAVTTLTPEELARLGCASDNK
jgi:hypothetical protein